MNYFEIKREIYNELMRGKEVAILDPKNEYKELAGMLGGKVITINPNTSTYINPFEIDVDNVIIKAWQRYKPNNWLRMHGIPMRRKPMRREKQIFAIDEFHIMFNR